MKILQDSKEEIRKLGANFNLKVVERRPSSPKSIILLLHGLDERGLRIYRKLLKYLPEDAYILAPNAPFPLPREKADRLDFGYTWYFYDRFTKSYQIDQTFSVGLLLNLLQTCNPNQLPVTIIGFSQGGYLAPLVGFEDKNTKLVVGIGCEFRNHFFQNPPAFSIAAIHGSLDTVIPPDMPKNEIDLLRNKGISVSWHLVPETKHEISPQVGEELKHILER